MMFAHYYMVNFHLTEEYFCVSFLIKRLNKRDMLYDDERKDP